VFFARWLLGYDAAEWWEMDNTKRTAYERGMREWLPQILFGVDGIDPKKRAAGKEASLSDLPGGSIVKAGDA
jgi:hypothetical protein